ncbi:hypothetical protein ELH35_30225 (plasmid) [Rhizobium ruizarguesonis]|nr:hypothetical protein ELI39_28705 [Rhizobium ruizarguesonis]TBC24187.1 hypothetical protein ELH35_30225 [Rhizobium ruizarguesonis]
MAQHVADDRCVAWRGVAWRGVACDGFADSDVSWQAYPIPVGLFSRRAVVFRTGDEPGRLGRTDYLHGNQSNWSHRNEGCATIARSLAFRRITPSDAARQRIAEGREIFSG